MIIVNRTGDSITGSINGNPYSIPFQEYVYEKLVKISANLKEENNAKSIEEALKLTTLNFNELVADDNPYLLYNPVKKEYFLVKDKGTKKEVIDYRAIPELLVDKITESFEKNFDYMPIVKAWARFLARERFKPFVAQDAMYFATFLTTLYCDYEKKEELIENEGLSEEAAQERSTFPDIALTQEGFLALYKVVEEVKEKWIIKKDEDGNPEMKDGQPVRIKVRMAQWQNTYDVDEITGEIDTKESKPEFAEDRVFTPAIYKNGEKFYSGDKYGYMYKVGEPQYLPEEHPDGKRATVNHNNTFGGGGLYAGGLLYIERYRTDNTPVLVCFVDPANIISFQHDGHAMRLWELFPHNILEDDTELQGFYHSSKYAEESKEKTAKRMDKVIHESEEEIKEELKKLQDKFNVDNNITDI